LLTSCWSSQWDYLRISMALWCWNSFQLSFTPHIEELCLLQYTRFTDNRNPLYHLHCLYSNKLKPYKILYDNKFYIRKILCVTTDFLFIRFVRLLALRPLLAYCASLGW
jgi:hypothetical protein